MSEKPNRRGKGAPRITFDATPHLVEQIKKRAVRERSTIRLMMLDALKAYGFDIPDEDMVLDRRLSNPGRPKSKAA